MNERPRHLPRDELDGEECDAKNFNVQGKEEERKDSFFEVGGLVMVHM